MNVKLPRIENVYRLDIPRGLQLSVRRVKNTFQLATTAIEQPKVELYPSLRVEGDLWRYQSGNNLVEVEGGKERIIKCNLFECEKAWEVFYAKVDDSIEPILRLGNKYVFDRRVYSKVIRRDSSFLLINGKDSLVLMGGKEIPVEPPLSARFSLAGISLLYQDETLFIDWGGRRTNFNIRGTVLHFQDGDLVYKNEEGALIRNGKAIGICREEAEVVFLSRDRAILSCGKNLMIYYNSGWINLSRDFDIRRSSASENYIVVTDNGKTAVYDMDLFQLFSFKPCTTGVGLRKGIFINESLITSVIDLGELETMTLEVMSEGEGKLKLPKGYEISTLGSVTALDYSRDHEYSNYLIENLGRDSIIDLTIRSPFLEQTFKFELPSANITVSFEGILQCAKDGGKVKVGEGNCVLLGSAVLSKALKSASLLRIDIEGHKFILKLEPNQRYLKVFLSLFLYNIKNIFPLKLTLEVDTKEVYTTELILTRTFVDPPREWRSEIRDLGHVKVRIWRSENDLFVWERKWYTPTYDQKLVINKFTQETKGSKVSLVKVPGKPPFISLGLENVIENVVLKVEGNYLIVEPIVRTLIPLQVYYGTSVYTGFPVKILLPLDPVYNRVIIRSFVGNIIFEKELEMNSLNITLNNAIKVATAIKDRLESIGVL